MLRTLNIPSRVVNGFRTTEFNDLTKNYLIRASSAHSWVEAYFPGSGWVTFDPTPGGSLSGATGWDRVSLYIDAMASFWREWVINYDASHQKSLGEDAMQGSRSLFETMRNHAQRWYGLMLGRARRAQRAFSSSPRRWSGVALIFGTALIVAANFRHLRRWMNERRLAVHPEAAPSRAAAVWYQRMLKWVGKQGWKKSDVQTPREFLVCIEDPYTRERVEDFTRAYEAARFGESSEAARQLPELYEELISAERK
jgi:hypothetical protein